MDYQPVHDEEHYDIRSPVGPYRHDKKGTFRRFIESTFAFNRMVFTVVFLVVYLVVMFTIAGKEDMKTPSMNNQYPSNYSIDAFTDLQVISKTYHPINSHANDDVHDYILKQVQAAVAGHPNVEVVDDVRKQLFSQRPVFDPTARYENAIFSENNNILVKIPGINQTKGAVLLSAHFDSVATGRGTIDDGTGIVSMIAALRYLVDNNVKLERTVIFNFNNNEEPGLIGAEMFRFHPWSHQVEYFVNLEGAGAYGKPVMFRATDTASAKHYKAAHLAHGNSILQQGFQSGLIGSQTDYKVYQDMGYRGVDIAFYKGRSLYHTKRDNIHASSVESISHMLSAGLSTVMSMAMTSHEERTMQEMQPAVYIDAFGRLFVYSVSTVLAWHVVGLVGGPILVALLLMVVLKTHSWDLSYRGWGRGVLSLSVSTLVTVCCAMWIFNANRYVMNSQLYSPLIALMSIFLLVNYAILGLAWYIKPVHDQKLILFIEILVFWWIALVYATIETGRYHATGYYIVTILYYLSLTAVSLGLLGLLVARPKVDNENDVPTVTAGFNDVSERSSLLNHRHRVYHNPALGSAASASGGSLASTHPRLMRLRETAKKGLSYDWSIQFIVVVPIGLVSLFTIATVVIDAMHDTPPVKNEALPFMAYFVTLFAVLMGLLVVPFIHRTHFFFGLVLLLLVVMVGFKSLVWFPFTQEWPLATMFVQKINLNDNSQHVEVSAPVSAGYLESALSSLPYFKTTDNTYNCVESESGHTTCSYKGQRPWVLPQQNYTDWMDVQATTYQALGGANQGRVLINAPDNRVCGLVFNTTNFQSGKGNSPVKKITFANDININTTNSSVPSNSRTFPRGAHSLSLYTMNWTQPFYDIDIHWAPSWDENTTNRLGITVTCSWSEWDQEITAEDGKTHRKIPALDELLEYSPVWLSWRKAKTGLVEVVKYVEI